MIARLPAREPVPDDKEFIATDSILEKEFQSKPELALRGLRRGDLGVTVQINDCSVRTSRRSRSVPGLFNAGVFVTLVAPRGPLCGVAKP